MTDSSKQSYSLNTSYTNRLIKNKKWNRQILSDKIPASTDSIHRWLSGKSKISARKLILLARALDVDPCALLETDDKRVHNFLRDLLNRVMEEHKKNDEDDVELVDIPTFISIVKTLGMDKKSDVKVAFNIDDYDIPNTQAEDQIRSLLGQSDPKEEENSE